MEKKLPPLESMTLRQLRKIASILNIPLYSRMRKAQLLDEIKHSERKLLDNYLVSQ